jgi:hypothetical protein
MLKQFKRLHDFYFRISAIIFGKQSSIKVIAQQNRSTQGMHRYHRFEITAIPQPEN